MAGLLPIDEALRRVLERVQPLETEAVDVTEAPGRVLAAAARSIVDLPPFDSSAMDGYTVRAADTPGELPVTDRIAAGRPATRALAPGQAMAIATGGEVPEGADAVVPIEAVTEADGVLHVTAPVAEGAHVRPRGGDLRDGETIVEAGIQLGSAHIAALAAGGAAELVVARRPRVAVLTTGTELRPPGSSLEPGQIYDSNGPMLAALVRSAGGDPTRLEAVADEAEAHRDALRRGLEHDVLVSSGGVSVGPHDLVRGVGAELGVEEVFWRIAMRPGKPLWFGVRGATLVFGLPGNPVSSLVCFELFVRPALLALQGHRSPEPAFEPGTLGAALHRNPVRDDLARARRDGRTLLPISGQESHMIARSAEADALVLIPRGDGEIAAGETVQFLRLVR